MRHLNPSQQDNQSLFTAPELPPPLRSSSPFSSLDSLHGQSPPFDVIASNPAQGHGSQFKSLGVIMLPFQKKPRLQHALWGISAERANGILGDPMIRGKWLNQTLSKACELAAPDALWTDSAELENVTDDAYAARREIMSTAKNCQTIMLPIHVAQNYWNFADQFGFSATSAKLFDPLSVGAPSSSPAENHCISEGLSPKYHTQSTAGDSLHGHPPD